MSKYFFDHSFSLSQIYPSITLETDLLQTCIIPIYYDSALTLTAGQYFQSVTLEKISIKATQAIDLG